MSVPKPPDGFKVSASLVGKLPESERAEATEHLWVKSGGLCALCDQPLPNELGLIDQGSLDPDHYIPEHADGPTVLKNIYLAHKSCNRRRRDLPFELAHVLIRYTAWSDRTGRVSFDNVLDEYVKAGRQNLKISMAEDKATYDFGHGVSSADVACDPATGTPYFFAEVPITHILNDRGDPTSPLSGQPRFIEADHVWELAADFDVRPVHEPSNCRLAFLSDGVGQLLQFDGQHKTAAQIILGRTTVPMKIYVDPDRAMIQELILAIQQRIKKRPLSTSDTLAKLGVVVAQRLDAYRKSEGLHTEAGYIASQPADQRNAVKREWLQELEREVLFADANKLRQYIGTSRGANAVTDKVVTAKLIRPFIYQGLLTEDMEQTNGRDHERAAILLILNTITEKMIEPAAPAGSSDLLRRRMQNFLYQGSISWWATKVLIPALLIRLEIPSARHKAPFLQALSAVQVDKLRELIDQLCSWDIWSLGDDSDVVKAMRSNVPSDVAALLTNKENPALTYNEFRLIREVIG